MQEGGREREGLVSCFLSFLAIMKIFKCDSKHGVHFLALTDTSHEPHPGFDIIWDDEFPDTQSNLLIHISVCMVDKSIPISKYLFGHVHVIFTVNNTNCSKF